MNPEPRATATQYRILRKSWLTRLFLLRASENHEQDRVGLPMSTSHVCFSGSCGPLLVLLLGCLGLVLPACSSASAQGKFSSLDNRLCKLPGRTTAQMTDFVKREYGSVELAEARNNLKDIRRRSCWGQSALVVASIGNKDDFSLLWSALGALASVPYSDAESAVTTDSTLAIGILARFVGDPSHDERTLRHLLSISDPKWWMAVQGEAKLSHESLFRASVVLGSISQLGSDKAEMVLLAISRRPDLAAVYGSTASAFLAELIAANRKRMGSRGKSQGGAGESVLLPENVGLQNEGGR